jgi:hypothetical protein
VHLTRHAHGRVRLTAVCDSAEDALIAALAIPLPAPERTRYDPQPGLAELYAAARDAVADGDHIDFQLASEPGHMSAGLQLLVHQAVDAGLAARTGADHATVRLTRHGEHVEVAVELGTAHERNPADIAKVSRVAALYGGAITWVDDSRLVLRVPE